ncbi:uncharacterized protein LOC144453014 [Glandiceps talaboti]
MQTFQRRRITQPTFYNAFDDYSGDTLRKKSDREIKYEIMQMRHSLSDYIERQKNVYYGQDGRPIAQKLPVINNACESMTRFPNERVQSGYRKNNTCCLCQLQRRGQICGRTNFPSSPERITPSSRARLAKEFCEVLGVYSCRDCMREKKRIENEFDYIRNFPPVREINPRTLCAETRLSAEDRRHPSNASSSGQLSPAPSDHSHGGSVLGRKYFTGDCVTDNEIHRRVMRRPRRMSGVRVRFKDDVIDGIPERPAPANSPVEWERNFAPPTV